MMTTADRSIYTIAAIAIFAGIGLAGCVDSPIAWRGVIYQQQQEASTEGRISTNPSTRDSNVNAEKTTTATATDTFKADVPAPKEATP